ncbi:nicotinate phosphoribosyltransferase [Endozoicomonas sp. (ex Bugula neritina AB1)]|nr:nicotinate phosphoribosyltransferase [Endozoicomonas sp. (ex Bugula neritina AB1)]
MDTPIIQSLLDTDLYKYTMQQSMVSRYGKAKGKMAFRCRTDERLQVSVETLRQQCDFLGDLQLRSDELEWLAGLPFITESFLEYLRTFKMDPRQVEIIESKGEFFITAEGNWAEITHFEIFMLAMVSELHCRERGENAEAIGKRLLSDKVRFLKDSLNREQDTSFTLVDFGTRRRYSREWHAYVVRTLKQELPEYFVGTSNLHLARTLGLQPMGTMAHEWLQSHQVLGDSLLTSQKDALTVWLQQYGDQLGIALTDTISMQAFLRDFDKELASTFSGIRHDSGDPIHWGEQALAHYRKLGVDPATKQFVFSDKLDFVTALDIQRHFSGQVNVSFGIGSYLTNDMGFKAPNIVMKLVELNDKPVAKLSDNPSKTMCQDLDYVSELKRTFAYV